MRRSMLLHGLKITLSRPQALLWTYAFNVGLALLFSWRLDAQFDDILGHSLAAERLTSAFDLGVVANLLQRVGRNAPSTGQSGLVGPALYFLVYFLLVPGTLFCYQTGAPAKLSVLLRAGLERFWRFFRITLLALIVGGLILGPLFALRSGWQKHVDEHVVGRFALAHALAGYLLIAVVACVLRLYFDLVEVYTVQLGERLRPDGRPDRRVRRALLPALRTLRRNFWRGSLSFITLTALGFLALLLAGRAAMHTLAQPRVWPMFLLAHAGLFLLLFTRFWQRGAETVLAMDDPIPLEESRVERRGPDGPDAGAGRSADRRNEPELEHEPERTLQPDAQPDPEPAPPSLDEPDPGVFHHDPPAL